MKYKKEVFFDPRALKEFNLLQRNLQDSFYLEINKLEVEGFLIEPLAKKLLGYRNLFELRVRRVSTWRAIYAYIPNDKIIILNIFKKQSQETPHNNLEIAINRLKNYL